MIRVIASDMDGTLLGTDHKATPENIDAIREARQSGVDFVVVTSRSFSGIEDKMKRSGLINGYVLNGGAEVRSGDGLLLESIPMERKQCAHAGKLILSFQVTLIVSNGEQDLVISDEKELREILTSGKPIYKMFVYTEERSLLGRIRYCLKDSREISVTTSYVNNLEITDAKAQKGPVLKRYLTGLGYQMDEIMVIGDSMNDYSMFSLDFGIKVAMGNAVPELKQIAGYITKTNNESGVAYAIREMMKRQEGEEI